MKTFTTFFAILVATPLFAQEILTLDEMIDRALNNNERINAAALDLDMTTRNRKTTTDIGKASIVYMRGQINAPIKGDNSVVISQTIPMPLVMVAQGRFNRSLERESGLRKAMTENELAYQVKQAYYTLLYAHARADLLQEKDSIFNGFVDAVEKRYDNRKSTLLEKATAEAKRNEVQNDLVIAEGDIIAYRNLLQTLLNSDEEILTGNVSLTERPLDLQEGASAIDGNPEMDLLKQQIQTAAKEKSVASARILPDINIGYFTQTFIGSPFGEDGTAVGASDRFDGFQVGLTLPLWFVPQVAKVKAAELNRKKQESLYAYQRKMRQGEWQRAVQNYLVDKNSVDYYQSLALKTAEEILNQSTEEYRQGIIGYSEFWLAIEHVIGVREGYLAALNELNQSVIQMEFLAGEK